MNVDIDRLQTDIEANATFGAIQTDNGRGRTVLTGTVPNRQTRERLVDRLEQADLEVRIDAVGNIAGRWSPPSANAAPVAAGSHLDSVPEGGIFDGPLGVYAALEAVRTMQDANHKPAHPIDVVCFTEEEGQRFGTGTLGSAVAAGDLSIEAALELTDDDGITLDTALMEKGFRGEDRINARNWDAWLELHIEQSSQLEAAGIPVGVVATITGITHCEVIINGEANHAGTTPMNKRIDGLTAASEFILDVEAIARETATEDSAAVGTVGNILSEPNATNVVPGQVEMGIDVRSTQYDSMNRIIERLQASIARIVDERDVEIGFEREFDLKPTLMSDRCYNVAHKACETAEIDTLSMHSGAVHDTMHIADVTDAGLLFAPSQNGISHSPREWTDWDDCATATQALTETLATLAM